MKRAHYASTGASTGYGFQMNYSSSIPCNNVGKKGEAFA